MTSYLFVHQNFPGQFPHIARALAERGHTVVAIGQASSGKRPALPHPDIRFFGYAERKQASGDTHHYLRGLEAHVRRGQDVVRVAQKLIAKGFKPDVVVAHPGWGEALFLRDVFPKARHLHYLEFFYRADGADVGFDPEFPSSLDVRCKVRVKNATQMIGFDAADAGMSPTLWQKSRYPADWQARITQLHDGIDTAKARPDAGANFTVKRKIAGATADLVLSRADEVLTYVARNLEPYRGFHTFMRALPAVLEKRPQAQVLIVGGDGVSYGRPPPEDNYREQYVRKWGNAVDLSRGHFLGRLPYADYLRVLQVSSLHVYLTYPFVLSWSLLEAMSAGCVVLGSATEPVREVIHDGENGYLTDFFDADALVRRAAELLASRNELQTVRTAARETVLAHYDLHGICLPRLLDFVL